MQHYQPYTMAQRPNSCKETKNHCNVCLQKVSNKNGLQCQGTCRRWVHFKCLNYTPGKIKDVKKGIIRVSCPCPNCKTVIPKENRTDGHFNCSNARCPANLPPLCDNHSCPSNLKHVPTQGNCYVPLDSCNKKNCKIHQEHGGIELSQPPSLYSLSAPNSQGTCLPPSPVGDQQKEMPHDLCAVDRMCNTVGQLTDQIQDLMNELKKSMLQSQESHKHKSCNQKDKSNCSYPCHCPQKR